MTDTQADLTERARKPADDVMRAIWGKEGFPDEFIDAVAPIIAAFAQSEREATAAEARRAAIEDAAKICDDIRDEYLTLPRRDPDHDYTAMAGYCAGAIRALASPAPQEKR